MVSHVHSQTHRPAGSPASTGGQFETVPRADTAELHLTDLDGNGVSEYFDPERDILYLSAPKGDFKVIRAAASDANRTAEKTVIKDGGKNFAVLLTQETKTSQEFEVHGLETEEEMESLLAERGLMLSSDGLNAYEMDGTPADVSAKVFRRSYGDYSGMITDAVFTSPTTNSKAARTKALSEARAFLGKLKKGSQVLVTQDGKESLYEVSQELHLQDGGFGHPDSAKVTLRIVGGHGYAFDVSPEGLAYGFGPSPLKAVHKA